MKRRKRRTAVTALGLTLASGCSTPDGPGPTGDTDPSTDMGSTSGEPAAPVLSGVVVIPNPINHLAVTVRFETDVPSVASVRADDGAGHVRTAEVAGAQTSFSVDLVGLRAGRSYGFQITATGPGGEARDDGATYDTDPLPDDFPPIEASGVASDGWTLFDVAGWAGGAPDPEWGLLVAVDGEGEVVWYHRMARASDTRVVASGDLWVLRAAHEVRVIDWMGRTGEGWNVDEVQPPAKAFHHEAFELSTGNLLTLSVELRNIPGYDDGMGGTVAHDVVGDVVLEVDGAGQVVHTRSLFDLLPDDHHRVRSGFDQPFWDATFAEEAPGGTKDWSHGNAVIHDPDEDLLLVCARHLDWVVAYERDTGALAWKLGVDGDFALAAGGEWFYHAHAPELAGPGRLLIYDNGNDRPGTGSGPGDIPPYSRAVLYDLDTSSWTATEVWSLETGEYAPFLGDADLTPEGTVLVTHGGQVGDPFLAGSAPANPKWARVVELDPGSGDELFSVVVGDPDAAPWYTVYRAERIADPQG